MYKFKKDDMRVPAYVWSSEGSIEEGALEQLRNASKLPFAFHHVVLCPDGHQGYGAPIGGVMAAKRAVVVNFIGVDIGCGMCAVKTSLNTLIDFNTELLKQLMGRIRQAVPVGFEHHKEPQENDFSLPGIFGPIITQEEHKIDFQIGTLGGGNHFIEIQKDRAGDVWIMIHSGSRNLGKKVADYYNKLAVKLNAKWYSSIDPKWELAFLPMDTDEYKMYMNDMQICVDFALANRQLMMDRICNIFANYTGCLFDPMINIAHNYAKMENHFGENVLVHRKGATSAKLDEIGIIPGSQGSKSYIVRGLGNPQSFESCSHGAGRKMGRAQATRTLSLEDEIRKLDEQGILHSIRGVADLDEAAGAYKDISEVMEHQKDLVEIVTELTPLGVIKG